MSQNFALLPTSVFAELELNEGDVVLGQTHRDGVRVHVRRKSPELPKLTIKEFLAKWSGQLEAPDAGNDPRLEALIAKHLR